MSCIYIYHQVNIVRTLVGNKIVDQSDVHVVGASPVGTAPTASKEHRYHVSLSSLQETTAVMWKEDTSMKQQNISW